MAAGEATEQLEPSELTGEDQHQSGRDSDLTFCRASIVMDSGEKEGVHRRNGSGFEEVRVGSFGVGRYGGDWKMVDGRVEGC